MIRTREREYSFSCRSQRMRTAFTGGRATLGASYAVDGRCVGLADAVPGQRNECVLQGAAAGLLPQCRGGALGDDPAVVDDCDLVGNTLRLLHVVRRKNTVTCSSRHSPRMNSQ